MICLTTKTILTLRAEAMPEGGVLPSNRLMGMRHWMGSHVFMTGLTTMGLHYY